MDNNITPTLESTFSNITELVSSLHDSAMETSPQSTANLNPTHTHTTTPTTTKFTIITSLSTEKKRPGRPRKNPESTLTEIVKRGRGRPRKYTIEERPSRPKLPPLIDENGNIIKRKRGRPRKNPLPDNSKPKRGRGRPRKDTIDNLTIHHQQQPSNNENNNNNHTNDEPLNLNINLMDLYSST